MINKNSTILTIFLLFIFLLIGSLFISTVLILLKEFNTFSNELTICLQVGVLSFLLLYVLIKNDKNNYKEIKDDLLEILNGKKYLLNIYISVVLLAIILGLIPALMSINNTIVLTLIYVYIVLISYISFK